MNFTLKHLIIVFLLVFIKNIYAHENFKHNFEFYEDKNKQKFKNTIELLNLLGHKDTSITLYSNENYCILFDKDKMQYNIKSKQGISALRKKNECGNINNNPFLVFDDYGGKNFFEKFFSSKINQYQGDKYKEILLKEELWPCSVGFFLNYKNTLKEFLEIFENANGYYPSGKIITSLNKIKKLLSDIHNIGTIDLQFSTLIIKLLKKRLTELITEMFSCNKTMSEEIIKKININIQDYHDTFATSHFINILNYEELRKLIKTMFENDKTTRAKLRFNLDENYILASKYLDYIGAKDSPENEKYKIFRDNFNSAINEKLNDLELNYHKKDIPDNDLRTIKENIIEVINKSLPNILLEENEIGEININIDDNNHEAKVIIENIMIYKNSGYYKSFCDIKSQINTIDSEIKNIISSINNIIVEENILEKIKTYTEYEKSMGNIYTKLGKFHDTINDLYPKSRKYNTEKNYKVFFDCEKKNIDKLFQDIKTIYNLSASFNYFVYFFDEIVECSNKNYIELKKIIGRGLTDFIHPNKVDSGSVKILKKTLKGIPLNFYFFSCDDSFIILNQRGGIREIFKDHGEKKSKEDAKKIIIENLENYFNKKICNKEGYIRINTQKIDKYKDSLINSYEKYNENYYGYENYYKNHYDDENTKIFKSYPDYIIDNCKKSFIKLILKDLNEIITEKLLEIIKTQLNNENKNNDESDNEDKSDSSSDESNDEEKLDGATKKLFQEILYQIKNKEKNNKDKKKIKQKEENQENNKEEEKQEKNKKENKEENNIKKNNKDKKEIKPKEENKKENKEEIYKFLNKNKKLNTSIIKKNHIKKNSPGKGNKEKRITQISQNQAKNCNCRCCKHNN